MRCLVHTSATYVLAGTVHYQPSRVSTRPYVMTCCGFEQLFQHVHVRLMWLTAGGARHEARPARRQAAAVRCRACGAVAPQRSAGAPGDPAVPRQHPQAGVPALLRGSEQLCCLGRGCSSRVGCAGGQALLGNCVDRCRHGSHTEGSNLGQWQADVAVRCSTLEQSSCLACLLALLECAALLVQHVTRVLRRARRSRVPSWSWSGACGLPHHPCPAAPWPPQPVSDPTCWSCVLPATLSVAAASAACARAPCE